MNRYTYSITILIFLISGTYAVTVCKCKSNTSGLYCGAELDCIFDPNDDPDYGFADIWQCGPATPETNFCWLGHCTSGCCQNNDGNSCCKGGSKCSRCDVLAPTKQPSTTRRKYPGTCSFSPTGMSFPTPVDTNPPPNTSPPNVSPSNTNPPNTSFPNASPTNSSPTNSSPTNSSPTNSSPPSTSPIQQDKNKGGIIAGSTVGSVLGLGLIIIIVIKYIRKKEKDPSDSDGNGIVRNDIVLDDGDD